MTTDPLNTLLEQAEAERNRTWDPNAPLGGKPAALAEMAARLSLLMRLQLLRMETMLSVYLANLLVAVVVMAAQLRVSITVAQVHQAQLIYPSP